MTLYSLLLYSSLMTFTVKYRASDGAIREECIEAANRSECLEKCKARRISLISINIGTVVNAQKNCPTQKVWLSALAAVAGIVCCIWNPFRHITSLAPKETFRNFIPSEATVLKDTVHAKSSRNISNQKPKIEMHTDNLTSEWKAPDKAELQQPTNNAGPLQKQIFKSGTEQVISWIFMCPVGSMPPILPTLPESELSRIEEILNSENIISEIDEERIAEVKETVDYVKKELKQFLSEGGKVEDFLKYYHSMLVKAHRTREESRKIVEEVEQTNPEIAESFKEKVNERLREDGVLELETDTIISEETER